MKFHDKLTIGFTDSYVSTAASNMLTEADGDLTFCMLFVVHTSLSDTIITWLIGI